MVYPDSLPQHLDACQVIYGEIGTPLVFILQESEALGFTRIAIANEVYMYRFAVLREDGDNVSFVQFKR